MQFPFFRQMSLCVLVVLTTSLFAQQSEAGFVPSGVAMVQGDTSVADDDVQRMNIELKKIRGRFRDLGLTDRETEERLSRLNAEQIHQLSLHVDEVRVGGGWEAIGIIYVAVIGLILIYTLFFSKARNAAPAS